MNHQGTRMPTYRLGIIGLGRMGSTIDPERFPVFDDDVEAIQEGYGVRLGLRNTLQTQRGGPGRWRG